MPRWFGGRPLRRLRIILCTLRIACFVTIASALLVLPRFFLPPTTFLYQTKYRDFTRSGVLDLEPIDVGETLLVVSFSGGGSRAAFFASTVMLELQRLGPIAGEATGATKRFLDEVDAISSVSGGSLAAGYLVRNFKDLQDATFSGGVPPAWRRFGDTMAFSYTQSAIAGLFLPPWRLLRVLWGEPWGSLVAEAFDDKAFHGATLKDLPRKPILMINATESALGPFVFSAYPEIGLPPSRGRDKCTFSTFRPLPEIPEDPTPLTLEWANIDNQAMHLSHAVYASAAVPGLLNPFVLRGYSLKGGAQYLKLLDGGVWDNTGIATLYVFTDQFLLERCHPLPSSKTVVMLGISAMNVEDLRVGVREILPNANAQTRVKAYLESTHAPALIDLASTVDLIYQRREELQSDYYAATYLKILCEKHVDIRFETNEITLYDLRILGTHEIASILERRDDLRSVWMKQNLHDGMSLWVRITEIPTAFQLSAAHRELLELAAGVLVESQGRNLLDRVYAGKHRGRGSCSAFDAKN